MIRITFIVASLLICTISFAQTQASQEEIALAQRIYQAQEQGDEASIPGSPEGLRRLSAQQERLGEILQSVGKPSGFPCQQQAFLSGFY